MKKKTDAIPLTVIRLISKIICRSCDLPKKNITVVLIFGVIPVIFFIILYVYRHFSDETSAIEAFQDEHGRGDENKEEFVQRKSEKIETKHDLKGYFLTIAATFRTSTINSHQLNLHFTEGSAESVQDSAGFIDSFPA